MADHSNMHTIFAAIILSVRLIAKKITKICDFGLILNKTMCDIFR